MTQLHSLRQRGQATGRYPRLVRERRIHGRLEVPLHQPHARAEHVAATKFPNEKRVGRPPTNGATPSTVAAYGKRCSPSLRPTRRRNKKQPQRARGLRDPSCELKSNHNAQEDYSSPTRHVSVANPHPVLTWSGGLERIYLADRVVANQPQHPDTYIVVRR